MNKDNIVDSLGRIDDDMIESVEVLRRKKRHPAWKKWSAMAACFCLLIVAAVAVPHLFHEISLDNNDFPVQTEPDQSEGNQNSEYSRAPWTIHFNEATSILAANRAYIKGTFTEPLNDTELSALQPSKDLPCTGYARFDNYGNLLDIEMQTATSLPESPVTIALADYYFGFDYVLSEGEVLSVCNGLEYKVYQYQFGDRIELSAYAIINDIYFAFAVDVSQDDLEQAKADFQYVLECFAYYEKGKPDLSIITAEEIPELMEQMFNTLTEAQTEPDFGRYLPSELPAGFGDTSIYRQKFQNSNFLTAHWSKGLDDLFWVITPYTEEDVHRLTSVGDKQNYDLSLYPIPRADSVPDELREIVDDPIFKAEELTLEAVYSRAYKVNDAGDTDGWRMKFSVRYEDVIVSISSKGVEPKWLYQQLVNLISE